MTSGRFINSDTLKYTATSTFSSDTDWRRVDEV